MSKPKRTKEEIAKDFSRLCVQAGQIRYQIEMSERDLSATLQEMQNLTLEAAALNKPEESENEKKD